MKEQMNRQRDRQDSQHVPAFKGHTKFDLYLTLVQKGAFSPLAPTPQKRNSAYNEPIYVHFILMKTMHIKEFSITMIYIAKYVTKPPVYL